MNAQHVCGGGAGVVAGELADAVAGLVGGEHAAEALEELCFSRPTTGSANALAALPYAPYGRPMVGRSLLRRLESGVERHGLLIRRLKVADEPALAAAIAASLDHLRPWMPWAAGEPVPSGARRVLLRQWEELWGTGAERNVGVFDDAGVAGVAGLIDRVGRGALEIGYWTNVGKLRCGVASTAAGVLTELAFEDPAVDRVEIHHDRANLASSGVPQRLGYRRLTERKRQPEAPADTGIEVVWIVTRAEWFQK